jgi:hypothetical protein
MQDTHTPADTEDDARFPIDVELKAYKQDQTANLIFPRHEAVDAIELQLDIIDSLIEASRTTRVALAHSTSRYATATRAILVQTLEHNQIPFSIRRRIIDIIARLHLLKETLEYISTDPHPPYNLVIKEPSQHSPEHTHETN